MGQPAITDPPWIAATKARFPRLFRGLDAYGFACGDGWAGIVTDLCERLDALARPRLRVTQVKQKFGVLRVYLEGASEAAFALVREAEAASGQVCEWCGAPGALTHDEWLLTLCPACQARWKREREAR